MNNTAISEIVKITALLLEYCDRWSLMVDELLKLADHVRFVEVPLEQFSNLDLDHGYEVREFEGMLGYWFGSFSHEAVWVLRETILTGTNPFFERFLSVVSPSVVNLLRVDGLSVESSVFICEHLGIENIEQLKKACRTGVLVESGSFSEREELDLLESIIRLEKTQKAGDPTDDLFSSEFDVLSERVRRVCDPSDSNVLFWANADALADAIIDTLRTSVKPSWTNRISFWAQGRFFNNVFNKVLDFLDRYHKIYVSWSNHRNSRVIKAKSERIQSFTKDRDNTNIKHDNGVANNEPLKIVKVGEVCRQEPVITQLDFLILTNNTHNAFQKVKQSGFVKDVISEEGRRLSVLLRSDFFILPYNKRPTPAIKLNFFTSSEFAWGTKKVLLSSSSDHWSFLKRRADLKGFKLTPWGVYKGVSRLSSRTAERLYEKLDLPFVPEELRRGVLEEDWIRDGIPKLLSMKDMRADLHMHTIFTDGCNRIEEMIVMAQTLGLEYIAVTDHTQNVVVANGMSETDFIRYWDIVDHINQKLHKQGSGFRVLKGAEVDILEHGGLDLSEKTLSRADWIVASIHVAKNQSREDLHRRYMDAFQCPYVDVIAHPTQRVIGLDSPMDVDLDFLCENAKKYGKCLELNSQPRRLDLDPNGLALARKYGVYVVISTDSHAAEQLTYLRFGVQQARCAGLTRDNVLNARSYDDFMRIRKELKESAS